MANHDYRIATGLRRNRKREKLLRKLGATAVLGLIDLWAAVAEDASSGHLEGWDKDDIEIAAGWTGQPGVFADTLTELNFLDLKSGNYAIHDWEEHNPWACNAQKRSERARAAARARWENNAGGMPPALPDNNNGSDGQSPTSLPDQTQDLSTTKPSQTPPASDDAQAGDIDDYVKMATDKAVASKKIRKSASSFAAAVRGAIEAEGGRLNTVRQSELAEWRKERVVAKNRQKAIQHQKIIDNEDTEALAHMVEEAYNNYLALPVEEQSAICEDLFGTSHEPDNINVAHMRSKIAQKMGYLNN